MAKPTNISPAEWDVMEVVWELGPCAAAEVIARLSETHDWKHRTVRTLLARLVEKGVLRYEVSGPTYIYRAAVARKHCVRREGRSFLDKVFGGDVAALVVHFVNDTDLDADELQRLRQLVDQKLAEEGRDP